MLASSARTLLGSLRTQIEPYARDGVFEALRLARLSRTRQEFFTVVTFHRILPAEHRAEYPMKELAVTPEIFRDLLGFFTARYTCGALGETWNRYRSGERPERPFLAITFDDGQRDNFLYAKQELERMGLVGTFYIPIEAIETGLPLWHDRLAYAARHLVDVDPGAARERFEAFSVDPTSPEAITDMVNAVKALEPDARQQWIEDVERNASTRTAPAWDAMMSWDEIRKLAEDGHEVGSHSITHALLPQLADEDLARELEGSKEALEAQLQREVPSFCYPNGDHDARVVAAVRKAGYAHAVTTKYGLNIPAAGPLELSRCDIQEDRSLDRRGHFSSSRVAWRLSPIFRL